MARLGLSSAAAAAALAVLASPAAAQSTATCTLNLVCEAETGTLHDGAGTEDEHAGYTGTGFVDQLFGAAGVKLTVNATEAISHRITVRYANANPGTGVASRRFTLTVNGTSDIPILFPPTSSWATWSTVTLLVPLSAGLNELDFRTGPENNGPINIDHIIVSPATTITEDGVTLRLFDIDTALEELCDLKLGQTPERRRAAADHRLHDRRRLGELLGQLSSRRSSPTSTSPRRVPTPSG